MIEEGTRLLIDGIPYRIVSAVDGTAGRKMLIIEHDTSTGTEIRQSIAAVSQQIYENEFDNPATARLIVDWFIDQKLKAGINSSQILAVKRKPDYAIAQIKRLLRQKIGVDEILEVLAFAITDKFWSGILNTSINTVATVRDDGLTLFEKIKSNMITQRHSDIPEVHQETADEMLGVIIAE